MSLEHIGVADAKRRFSELTERVRNGESFVIVNRGHPVVALVPPQRVADDAGRPPIGLVAIKPMPPLHLLRRLATMPPHSLATSSWSRTTSSISDKCRSSPSRTGSTTGELPVDVTACGRPRTGALFPPRERGAQHPETRQGCDSRPPGTASTGHPPEGHPAAAGRRAPPPARGGTSVRGSPPAGRVCAGRGPPRERAQSCTPYSSSTVSSGTDGSPDSRNSVARTSAR